MASRRQIAFRKLVGIFFGVLFLFQVKNVVAGENSMPDMQIVFAANAQGADPMFGKEIPWKVIRQFELLCNGGHCYLNVTTLNTETCDGKTKPTQWNVDRIDKVTYSNNNNDENYLEVKAAGRDAVFIKFKDGLIGDTANNSTENSFVLNYEDDDPTGDVARSIELNRFKSGKISKEEYQRFISHLDSDRTTYKKATKLSGSAVGLSIDYTAHGNQEVRSVRYTLLTAPVFCTIAFWPKMR